MLSICFLFTQSGQYFCKFENFETARCFPTDYWVFVISYKVFKHFVGDRNLTFWKSVKAALRVWPSLWVKGATVAARAQSEFRLTRMEDLYGSLPGDKAGQKDLEEVERRAGTIKGAPRGLPTIPPSLRGTSISDLNECEQCKFCMKDLVDF
jgi:hypothetical protein